VRLFRFFLTWWGMYLIAALDASMMFFLPFDLIQVQGYSATQAGAALVPFVLTMFLLSRWAGGLVRRRGNVDRWTHTAGGWTGRSRW